MSLLKLENLLRVSFLHPIFKRNYQTSQALFAKQINIQKEGKVTTISGTYVPPTKNVINNPHKNEGVCALCALNLNLKHTDVLILSQFTKPDGTIYDNMITGICGPQQRRLEILVQMAQRAGLMPGNCYPEKYVDRSIKRLPKLPYKRYFDDFTAGNFIYERIKFKYGLHSHPVIQPISRGYGNKKALNH